MRGPQNFPEHYTVAVSFDTYTPEETVKLSVIEINNPQNFDVLGYPTRGGVYDPALGPNEKNELCATCSLNYVHCPGHFGHINLPLPVFNPIFFNDMFQILRSSCFSCHRLLVIDSACILVQAQLKALNYGLVNVTLELEELAGDLQTKSDLNASFQMKSILDDHISKALKGIDKKKAMQESLVKNVIDCRSQIIRWFIHDLMHKRPRSCPHCKALKYPLYNLNKTRIIISALLGKKLSLNVKNAAAKKSAKKKKDNNSDDEMIVVESEIFENEVIEETEPQKVQKQTLLTPVDARNHMRLIWKKEQGLLQCLYKILRSDTNDRKTSPIDMFFLNILPVPPSRFRPISVVKEKKFENPQSAMLSKVVQSCFALQYLLNIVKSEEEGIIPDDAKDLLNRIPGESTTEKLHNSWSNLQTQVNLVANSDDDALNNSKTGVGVKQILEKKEGLFRMNMMGKRVDYAARSVISPDPFIGIDEIGIPEVFAKKLTYPQPVTPWNVREMRQLVINGANNYPGASLVKNEFGEATLLTKSDTQREAIAKTLLTPSLGEGMKGNKIVHRHLKDGDIVLVNRQPTLHRPSIMAHKARVLAGEKTLRLHYSNCKTYNADFDGDEMNVHFPQNEMARAEAEFIANVNNQYLVPKDGTPLGGLIQDHIVAGVHMTLRGRHFSMNDYQQLVYSALVDKKEPIQILRPCTLKPSILWSGKQVLSTVLMNIIPEDKAFINLEGQSKIPSKIWQRERPRTWTAGGTSLTGMEMTESEVIIRGGELVCGILDKAHYGPTPYGLVHSCYELYGGKISSWLLTALGRLFTSFLQMQGFTLGIEDICVKEKMDKKRRKVMKKARKEGTNVAAEAFGIENSEDYQTIKDKYEEAHHSKDDKSTNVLDMYMKSLTDNVNNDINNLVMPLGLLKQFPQNNLQLMVQSGAKGTSVNCMQISCLLGQIELEGKRPPLMLSGRTLPSFLSYDVSPRAGGFVDGRFLTGIQPQEYFFHCMAGREGLIDTAVKTSRSGYLQRCLVKHLEGLSINYDMTVRDNDGSVIQFLYGEDGLDIQKIPFFKEKTMPFLAKNVEAIFNPSESQNFFSEIDDKDRRKQMKTIRKWKRKNMMMAKRRSPFLQFSQDHPMQTKEELQNCWFDFDKKEKKKYKKLSAKCPYPVVATYRPDLYFGSVTETVDDLIENYATLNLDNVINENGENNDDELQISSQFRNMMYQKNLRALCHPGEAVGLLAAQSIGEPSTQMTLNTFHFAGRGEMNVTLGIPRLREILMTASANIATPSMEIPVYPECISDVEALKKKLTRVHLDQVLQDAQIDEWLSVKPPDRSRLYRIRLNFLPYSEYSQHLNLTPQKILKFVEHQFIKQLVAKMQRKFRLLAEFKLLNTINQKEQSNQNEQEETMTNEKAQAEEDESQSEDEGRGDGDTLDVKQKIKHTQEREYDETEEEDEQCSSAMSDVGDDYEDDIDEAVQSNADGEKDLKVNKKDDLLQTSVLLSSSQKQKLQKKKMESQEDKRIKYVLHKFGSVSAYKYDTKEEQWCEITFQLNIKNSKIDIMSVIEEEARKAVVYEMPNIKRAFVTEAKNGTYLKTEGVNIQEMFQYERILDINRLHSNDIHSIASTYGIEAAYRTIVKEIQAVFGVYGIEVDPRHLSLVADYMTFSGTYKPFNRVGLESNSSPLQQMSFETTMHFLKNAALDGRKDDLTSPSARIALGRPVKLGTGAMDMLVRMN